MHKLIALFSIIILNVTNALANEINVPHGNCATIASPPSFLVPRKYIECTSNNDCTLSYEGCRSCNCPIASHSHYVEKINEIDNSLRIKNNNMRTCEACSLNSSLVTASCIDGLCTTIKKNANQ